MSRADPPSSTSSAAAAAAPYAAATGGLLPTSMSAGLPPGTVVGQSPYYQPQPGALPPPPPHHLQPLHQPAQLAGAEPQPHPAWGVPLMPPTMALQHRLPEAPPQRHPFSLGPPATRPATETAVAADVPGGAAAATAAAAAPGLMDAALAHRVTLGEDPVVARNVQLVAPTEARIVSERAAPQPQKPTVPMSELPSYVDIGEYLSMSQSQAAKVMSVPTSTLSKRWKEVVADRKWPWRLVSKLDKQITSILQGLPAGEPMPQDTQSKLGEMLRERQALLMPVVIRL